MKILNAGMLLKETIICVVVPNYVAIIEPMLAL